MKWKKPFRPEGVPVWFLDGIVPIGEILKSARAVDVPEGWPD
jgi:hypothetical protein